MVKRKPAVLPGDTFAVSLGEGRFGAVRVLRTVAEEGTALVAVTPWLDTRPPALGEPALRQILRNYRGRYQGEPAICWYEGEPTADFDYLGSIPATEEELTFDPRGAYGGRWGPGIGREVLLEAGLKYVPSSRRPEPQLTDPDEIPESEFWTLIGLLDWGGRSDTDVVSPLTAALLRMSPAKILGFQQCLKIVLDRLASDEFAAEALNANGGSEEFFSTDHFLDMRCAVVANGKAFYEQVLADPSLLPKDREFEILLYVAEEAYRKKTGAAVDFPVIT